MRRQGTGGRSNAYLVRLVEDRRGEGGLLGLRNAVLRLRVDVGGHVEGVAPHGVQPECALVEGRRGEHGWGGKHGWGGDHGGGGVDGGDQALHVQSAERS